ncbi:hypothetical protein L1987_01362 [Smallanthus sonchifolius]|uniref:Uncharacterized protein n=1 Tax=Smallanthus sonchifolius TaxID=185202 RepID=A0ACB9K4V5_9ASTR|nr:hypothetical protein L1987_01362 [Smallanthus sonchifolius]
MCSLARAKSVDGDVVETLDFGNGLKVAPQSSSCRSPQPFFSRSFPLIETPFQPLKSIWYCSSSQRNATGNSFSGFDGFSII